MATPRPAKVVLDDQPQDDGLFGPESVSWRVMASPATVIGASAAVLVQMLHPRVMWMIDQASNFLQNPEKRARATGQYATTITYGDAATAEHAGEILRRIHDRRRAVDPLTGQPYQADEPDLLLWVHGALTWMLLHAYDQYGPLLSADERDQFVAEQRTSARLVGCTMDDVPGSAAELERYIERMRPQLAYTLGCRTMLTIVSPTSAPKTPNGWLQWLFGRAALDLLVPEHRALYGVRWNHLDRFVARRGAGLVIDKVGRAVPYADTLRQMRTEAVDRPFGRPPVREHTSRSPNAGTSETGPAG